MPSFGGYCPFPLRFGGAAPRVETVTNGLLAGRGTAYDTSTSSPIWVEDTAVGRALSSVWDYSELLGNQFNPARMSIMLPRWEKILAIPVDPTATLAERRATVLSIVSRTGVVPDYQEVLDRVTALVYPVTLTIVHNTPDAVGTLESWPGGWYVQSVGTTPPVITLTGHPAANYDLQVDIIVGGARGTATFIWTSDGGATNSAITTTAATVVLGTTGLTAAFATGTYDADNQYFAKPVIAGFWSSVASVTFLATKPVWMSENDYYDKVRTIFTLLDAFLPAWIGFHVARDGTTVGAFILDDVHNLDNERFS